MRRLAGGRVFSNYADEAWQASAFRLALIAVMTGSFAAGPAILRVGLGGPWSGYLIPVAMVAAAAGVFTTTLLGRPTWRDRRGSAFRLGEMLLLVIGVRVLVWMFAEGLPGLSDVPSWFYEPGRFFTGEFAFAALVCLFVWSFAVTVTSDFLELAIQPDEVAARQSREWGDSRSQWRVGRPMGRTELLQRFAVRWIGLGILFVVCAGMTRLDFSVGESGLVHVGLRGLGMRTEVVACLVCYFLAGLLLMSQGRLAVLRGRWYNQEVDVRQSLIGRWHVNSLVFVALIALVALLLPLGSTSWLTGAVEFVVALLARIILFMGFLIGLVIAFLAALLSRLFGNSPPPPAESVPPPQAVPSQAEMAAQLPPWLGNAVLWLVVALVAVFLLINFLRTTGLAQSKLGKGLIQLRLWWRARRARINTAVAARVTDLRRRLRRVRRRVARPQEAGTSRRGPFLPREQVRRYYLGAVKEAGDEGVVRPPHKTPIEFAEDLRAEWPETEGDVRELTEAFVDARYSEHEIGDREVSTAESAWRRLVRGLREARHRDSA
ncbi:MAG: DUF4129 domain-containing protein [Nitrososphaerales archaeon]